MSDPYKVERVLYREPGDRDDMPSGVRSSSTGGVMFFGGSRGQERVFFGREFVPELVRALADHLGWRVVVPPPADRIPDTGPFTGDPTR